tara:strand:- start:28 stop:834 length:807 start_codon:yes stop_codon:yes gene_type:complete
MKDLIQKVIIIALDAGKAVNNIFLKINTVCNTKILLKEKLDGSPVSIADENSQKIIFSGLSKLVPSYPIVSEEDSNSFKFLKKFGNFWLIDPLDGTKEFLSKSSHFTINISLISDGLAILGVVYAPALKQIYFGGRNFGSFLQIGNTIEKIQVLKDISVRKKIQILISRRHINEETKHFIQKFDSHEKVKVGSSLKFCLIASGQADLYPRLGLTSQWDTAAGQAILEAAGGYVNKLDGRPLRYGFKETLNPYFIASSSNWYFKNQYEN